MLVKVIGVSFINNNRVYYFLPNDLKLKLNDFVIVETERGLQYAKVSEEEKEIENNKLFLPLKKIIRKASKKDIEINKKNILDSRNALKYSQELTKKLDLNMKIFDALFSFDRKKLIFKFIADERVDFRELAKLLASKYKTRIELRQMGVRDKAKELGGIGPCGRKLCCSCFLNNFDSVSINMAKNQGIALNPSKINGVCGRLLCCLSYENSLYSEYKNELPKVGEIIKTSEYSGKVISVDVLSKKYKILSDSGDEIEIKVK